MKHKVLLSIIGKQSYRDQEPEVIELVTEGVMEFKNGGWDISYQESDLTGLQGVTTTFRVEPDKVTLMRTGSLRSTMEFQVGLGVKNMHFLKINVLNRKYKNSSWVNNFTPGIFREHLVNSEV